MFVVVMLELGIDEITLVLQPAGDKARDIDGENWANYAQKVINEVIELAGFRDVFGLTHLQNKGFNGYNRVVTFGEYGFDFRIAYHQNHPQMGVLVKFTAQSLAFYLEKTNLHVYEFMQCIQSDNYTQRLSRIDLTADFIDEDLDVYEIYGDLKDKKVMAFRKQLLPDKSGHKFLKQPYKLTGFIELDDVNTVYLGSAKSKSQLRIYNKKKEQEQRKGVRYEKARSVKNWVRFECVLRDEYAHQITDELLNVHNDDELGELVAQTIAYKFYLCYVKNGVLECPTEYTQALLDASQNNNFILKSNCYINTELIRKICYIFGGSGLMAIFAMIEKSWGMQGVYEFLNFLAVAYERAYEPNDQNKAWVRAFSPYYRTQNPSFDDFIITNSHYADWIEKTCSTTTN